MQSVTQLVDQLHQSALLRSTFRPAAEQQNYVVDLGGSTLRVAKVDGISVQHLHTQNVPSHAFLNPLEWLAATLDALAVPPFNLCWAFPLDDGRLLPMGKHWRLPSNLVGTSLVEQLNQKLTSTRVYNVIHDSTASLVAEHTGDPQCVVAFTWGTGYNVAVFKDPYMINCEMGAQDLHEELRPYDVALQANLPGDMPLEYMVGGIYLAQLYTITMGTLQKTADLWAACANNHETATGLVQRACRLVAQTIYAAIEFVDGPKAHRIVAYTGGVIFEPVVREMLVHELELLADIFAYRVTLVPQRYGPQVGASLISSGDIIG